MNAMAFIPVENTIQVELRYIVLAQQCENTLYFYNDEGYSASDLITLTGLVGDWWDEYLRPYQGAAVTMNEIYATDLTTATSPTYSDTTRNGQAGEATATAILPTNVTLTVSFRTQGRGRSARGRNYFVGLTEGSVVGNTVDTGIVTGIEAAYNNIPTAIGYPWTWVVVSRYFNGAPRTEGLRQTVTNAICVDPLVDSQRRRLTGRGL
jgi:hypothetical protein